MFNLSRARIVTGIGVALSLGASMLRAINPFSSIVPVVASKELTGSRGKRGTVAQAKRAAVKRRNQLRHKRTLRG
jgi:hypothetical protein